MSLWHICSLDQVPQSLETHAPCNKGRVLHTHTRIVDYVVVNPLVFNKVVYTLGGEKMEEKNESNSHAFIILKPPPPPPQFSINPLQGVILLHLHYT